MRKEIERILNENIRPSLSQHGGDIQLMDYRDGIVTVRLAGHCANCPSASLTTQYLVKARLQEELPEIMDVRLDERVDPELLAQARQILAGNPL